MSGIVVVDVDPEVAVQRLVAFRGFSEADARARMSRQASREERLARADVVIDNSGTPEDLARLVDELWPRIEELSRQVAEAATPTEPAEAAAPPADP
jgi:dephospho-CoA kinase